LAEGRRVIFTGGNGRSVIFTGGGGCTVDVVAGVTVTPVLCRFGAVCMGVVDINVAGCKVADVEVVDVKGADVNTGDDGVMAMWTACRVAANFIVDNELTFSSSSFFLFPNPFVNEDFTLRPMGAAALTAVCSRLSASDKNISGLIARWTAWILSESKTNPAVA
jgi:hypothetical protein